MFNTTPVEVLAATDVVDALDAIYKQLLKKIEEFEVCILVTQCA